MAEVTYGTPAGGGYQILVPGASGAGANGVIGGGVPPGMEWMLALAKRKADQEATMRQIQIQQARQAQLDLERERRSGHSSPEPIPDDYYTRTAKENALARDVAQTQALTQAAPSKTSFMANSLGGYTRDDPNAMTGAQRQAFLPASSSVMSIGGQNTQGTGYGDINQMQPRQPGVADMPGESIAEMSKRMYGGDWNENVRQRDAWQQQADAQRRAIMYGAQPGK